MGGQFDILSFIPNQTKHLGFCGRRQVGSLGVEPLLILDFSSYTVDSCWAGFFGDFC